MASVQIIPLDNSEKSEKSGDNSEKGGDNSENSENASDNAVENPPKKT